MALGRLCSRRAFSTTRPCLRFSLLNRVTPPELPFDVPFDRLTVTRTKKWFGNAHAEGEKGRASRLKWYPQVTIEFSVGPDCTWLAEATKEVLKEKYPIYYDPEGETFSVQTHQGNTFEGSLEQALDDLMYILYYCHAYAHRDSSKFQFDHVYFKWKMPLTFRHTEQKWLDAKHMQNAKLKWATLREPMVSIGGTYKRRMGYNPRPTNYGYDQNKVDSRYSYSPNVSSGMDPHERNARYAEYRESMSMSLGSQGVEWAR